MSEPRAVTADVRVILERSVKTELPDVGSAVAQLAESAGTSTRTIYRILGSDYRETMSLDLADRLLIASGAMLSDIRVQIASGEIVDYVDS